MSGMSGVGGSMPSNCNMPGMHGNVQNNGSKATNAVSVKPASGQISKPDKDITDKRIDIKV